LRKSRPFFSGQVFAEMHRAMENSPCELLADPCVVVLVSRAVVEKVALLVIVLNTPRSIELNTRSAAVGG
jgi:hypothetical protein